ncbi:MAG: hypothetical protein HQL73_11945 [Magnetococcales bacterium]|nr:hypothetical protein [Magnetococcales bacterium]
MTANATTRIYDWREMVALAEDGTRSPSVTYRFSNGRQFHRHPTPATPDLENDGDTHARTLSGPPADTHNPGGHGTAPSGRFHPQASG